MTFRAGGNVYCVNLVAQTISTAITIIQIKAGANPLFLLRAYLGQDNSVTSSQERVRILRKTSAATVTAFTPLLYDPSNSTSLAVGGSGATGTLATAADTSDSDVLVGRCFDVRIGFEWIATPMEMIRVAPGGIIAMKFPVAPASQLWTGQMVFCEG